MYEHMQRASGEMEGKGRFFDPRGIDRLNDPLEVKIERNDSYKSSRGGFPHSKTVKVTVPTSKLLY